MDEETTDPANIQYTVEQVVCDDCVSKRETGGEVVNHAGHKIMFFSQERINDGRVFFQHLAVSVFVSVCVCVLCVCVVCVSSIGLWLAPEALDVYRSFIELRLFFAHS